MVEDHSITENQSTTSVFRTAFECHVLPMALAEGDGRVITANKVFDSLFGDVASDAKSVSLFDLCRFPDEWAGIFPADLVCALGADGVPVEPKANTAKLQSYLWRVTACDGIVCLTGSNRATPSETSDLRRIEKKLAAILGSTVDGVITIDEKGKIDSFNAAAEDIFGYSETEVVGRNVNMLMPAPYQDEHDDYIENYLRTGVARIIGIGREVSGRRKDGSQFPMDLAVSEVTLEGTTTFTGIVRDITLRRELEKEILRIGDEERRRIGQDLHDELGQMLTGIGLMARNVSRRLASRDAPETQDVQQITQFIREADEYARTLARGLVPVELDANGLPAALTRLAANASTLFGIHCTFHSSSPFHLIEPLHGMHLYRIAQEALSNAARHGNASHVKIELTETERRVRLRIEDDGTGFDQDWDKRGGSGVRIMKYRASIVGGTLDISESVSGGTVVACTIFS
jgi:two-component system CheB/CheR fusion protein